MNGCKVICFLACVCLARGQQYSVNQPGYQVSVNHAAAAGYGQQPPQLRQSLALPGYAAPAAASAQTPPPNLPGLGQYQSQLAEYQRQLAHHNSFSPSALSAGRFNPASLAYQPQSGISQFNQHGYAGSAGLQLPAIPQYQPQAAVAPQYQPQPAPQYRPQPQYQAAPQPQYQAAPQPQAYGGQGLGAAGFGRATPEEPQLSHSEGLALHAKQLEAHNALVNQFTKDHGLDAAYVVDARQQPQQQYAPQQQQYAPQQQQYAPPQQQYAPGPRQN